MSRPGSRKAKGKKDAGKTPKKQIAELTEENTQLKAQIEALTSSSAQLREKVDTITLALVGSVNKRDFMITEQTDVTQLTADVLVDMVRRLVVTKRHQEGSVEARVEELETRVTQMSMDVAKLTKKCLAYECGLEEIARGNNMEAIKDRVYQLQFIAGKEYHSFAAASNSLLEEPPLVNGVDERPNTDTRLALENAEKLQLTPPTRKFPGETHIRGMHRDLRLYVMKELSREKASGADWRRIAERVGVPDDLTQYWKTLRLEYAMGRVFAEWGKSESATVRMLHRHLVSPQMKSTILAKRISDFYEVD